MTVLPSATRAGLHWSIVALLLLTTFVPCTTGEPIQAAAAQDPLELPVDGATTTLPLHLLARTGQPGTRVRTVLRWQNGIELIRTFPLLRNPDGQGVLVANLDWDYGTRPALPNSQLAALDLFDQAGRLLSHRELNVLGPDNPQLRDATLYWTDGDKLQPVTRRIPRTPRIASATLEELLWGPAPGDPPGVVTALPMPKDVLEYAGRRADWGERVQLRQVRIMDGMAVADFSRELGAYGGGSLRVGLIDQQITRTLEQFPSVGQVRIAIEGETAGVLEP
jgi:Sporulation and spore germination